MSSYLGLLSILILFSQAPAVASQTCESCTGANSPLSLTTYCWNPATSLCQSGLFLLGCPTNTTEHTYNCPVAPPSAFPYSDSFGRNKMLPFLAAAYGNFTSQAQTCLDGQSANLPGVTVLAQFNAANCSSILALNPQDQAIVVAFRGSVGLTQFTLVGLNLILGPQLPFSTGGTAYIYYLNCFNQLLANGFGDAINATKIANPSYGLWSFGHSLGASLASMTSAYAVYNGIFTSDEVKEMTTGQTRTGNLGFAQGHDILVPNAYRIVNQGDWITKLPPKLNMDDAGSFHHRHEVWYKTSMLPGSTFNVYDQAEDPSGSNSEAINVLSSDSSHNNYFNVTMDTWVNCGCTNANTNC